MATSQRSRVRKPESVQFWLCVGAVSLGLHSSLLFGLQRWAKVTLVQPDAGPIAVELMDAPDVVGPSVVASPVEPDAITQVPQASDTKPDSQPEVKLEVQPDVQPEAKVVRKPEPKRESNVPIAPSAEPNVKTSKPIASLPKATKNAEKPAKKTGPSNPVVPKHPDPTTPVSSSGQLPAIGVGKGSEKALVSQNGDPSLSKDSKQDLAVEGGTLELQLPRDVELSRYVDMRPGQILKLVIAVSVDNKARRVSSCNGDLKSFSIKVEERSALQDLVEKICQNASVVRLKFQGKTATDVNFGELSSWEITLNLTGQ